MGDSVSTSPGRVGLDTRLQSGQTDRFRTVYEQNVDAILRYALRRVAGPEDAADLVAETFLVAWRRGGEIPPGSEARLWLYGVARLVLANHRRGEGRRTQLGERLRLEVGRQLVVPDPADDVAGTVAVRAALARLEDGDRELLELTAWEELVPREIAVALGLSASVVRARLTRARSRLRHQLTDLAGDDPPPAGHGRDIQSTVAPKEAR